MGTELRSIFVLAPAFLEAYAGLVPVDTLGNGGRTQH